MKHIKLLLLFVSIAILGQLSAQTITSDQELEYYVNDILLGDLIDASNITSNFESYPNAVGEFNDFDSDPLGIANGLVLSTGNVNDIINPVTVTASSTTGLGSDIDLLALGNSNSTEATVIEFDFIPRTNIFTFNYVFASEEFPEYVGYFNDKFGFFLSGYGINGSFQNNAVNLAVLDDGVTYVSINSIYENSENYIDNMGSGTSIIFDGMSTVLQVRGDVVPGHTYHIKLAIGDINDAAFDSGVFLESGSFDSAPITFSTENSEDDLEVIEDGDILTITATLPAIAQTNFSIPFSLSGNAENGIDYEILSEQMIFYEGTQEAKIEILPLCDGLDEEVENIVIHFETLNESFEIDLINNSDCSIYQGTNVSDSLALVQFYNDNEGENWNNNSNWLSGNVSEWYGITLENNRVNEISLANNNIGGQLSEALGQLPYLESIVLDGNTLISQHANIAENFQLTYFNLANNGLINCPDVLHLCNNLNVIDLSNNNINNLDDALIFATTEEINLDGNALEFDDLEPFAEMDNISYQDQALIGEDLEIEKNEGESVEFGVNTSGEYNLYTWFKNGEPIIGELTNTLSLDNLDEDDEAIYYCEVNNSLITDLTITSALFELDVISDISIEESEEIIIFYPNPSNTYICFPEINMDRYEIYNNSGKLINSSKFDNRIDVSMLTSGQYIIKLINTKRVITKKFTKL
jgi:hypothetical protein